MHRLVYVNGHSDISRLWKCLFLGDIPLESVLEESTDNFIFKQILLFLSICFPTLAFSPGTDRETEIQLFAIFVREYSDDIKGLREIITQ